MLRLVHIEEAILSVDGDLAVHLAIMLDKLGRVCFLSRVLSTGRFRAVHEELQDLVLLNQREVRFEGT